MRISRAADKFRSSGSSFLIRDVINEQLRSFQFPRLTESSEHNNNNRRLQALSHRQSSDTKIGSEKKKKKKRRISLSTTTSSSTESTRFARKQFVSGLVIIRTMLTYRQTPELFICRNRIKTTMKVDKEISLLPILFHVKRCQASYHDSKGGSQVNQLKGEVR